MRIRSVVATLFVAVAVSACGDNATPTSPASPASHAVAPAAPHFDLVATGNDIDAVIDELYSSPIVRAYAHARWDAIEAAVAQCPPKASVLTLQADLNKLVVFLSTSAPRSGPKVQLFKQLVTDMSAYVNEAVSACSPS